MNLIWRNEPDCSFHITFELNGEIWWWNCTLCVIKVRWVFKTETKQSSAYWQCFNIYIIHHKHTITTNPSMPQCPGIYTGFLCAQTSSNEGVLFDSTAILQARANSQKRENHIRKHDRVQVYITSNQSHDSKLATTAFQRGSALWINKLETS